MMESSYVKILKHMQKQGSKLNPPSVQIGVMVSSNILKIGDLQLDKDNLLIADYLLSSYKRGISIPTTSASGNTTTGSISSVGIPNGNMEFTDTLKAGDTVAVIPINDGQTYVILARVVSL